MIKLRPTLPTGHTLAGLPPITTVIHADNRCELYGLEMPSGGEMTVLFLQRRDRSQLGERQLADWWAVQPTQVLEAVRTLTPEESPPNSHVVALRLRGHSLVEESLREAKEDSLRSLFRAMLELVDLGLTVKMYPDYDPSLAWLAPDGTAIATLLPLASVPTLESDQVRLVATAFYRIATGIELGDRLGDVPALLKWSKYGGEELSRIVDRCIAATNPKMAITKLTDLNRALGRERSAELTSRENQLGDEVPLEQSAAGQGLDKVAGMHVLKELLRREVVTPIRNPEPFKRYGLSIPNGILLYGPPGCGKTYIARQLAEELGHYFVEIIPSELASPYVHQSVIRIREAFDVAAEKAPAVMFIDEFEALVPPRGDLGGHQQHKAEEVNEFLAHLNGCSERRIFVIAASNQPDKIDPAVRRTGRLDKLIYVGPPDPEARKEMLAMHLRGRPVAVGFELAALADQLEGYSASDIRFLVDEAARDALGRAHDISLESFQGAMTRVQPSVTPEVEAQYRSIEQRGI